MVQCYLSTDLVKVHIRPTIEGGEQHAAGFRRMAVFYRVADEQVEVARVLNGATLLFPEGGLRAISNALVPD